MSKHLSFSSIARICELKTLYNELTEKVTIPTKRKIHNIENVQWFIKSGHLFNKNNSRYNDLLEVCKETLMIKDEQNGSKNWS